jgi:hypothetical protein
MVLILLLYQLVVVMYTISAISATSEVEFCVGGSSELGIYVDKFESFIQCRPPRQR